MIGTGVYFVKFLVLYVVFRSLVEFFFVRDFYNFFLIWRYKNYYYNKVRFFRVI